MVNIMLYILNNGGSIYYTDTDSIVTNIKLPDPLIHSKKLGCLKLEHEIQKAFFVADKTYAMITKKLDENGKPIVIIKSKGIIAKLLTYDDFIEMYENNKFDRGVKISSVRKLSSGSVTILTNKSVKLSLEFNKRYKVYVNDR